jgi:hypothetical protein
VSAPHPATNRAPSLTPDDLEAVMLAWRNRHPKLSPAEIEAAFDGPDFSTARRHDDDAQPRHDRLRQPGEIPGVDRWMPEEVKW